MDALNGRTLYRYDDQNNGDLKTIIAAATEYDTDPFSISTISEGCKSPKTALKISIHHSSPKIS